MFGFIVQSPLRPVFRYSRLYCCDVPRCTKVRTGVSVAVFNGLKSILLIRRGKEPNKGRWSLPGGRLREGEDLRLAALRELEEETGLSRKNVNIAPRPVEKLIICVSDALPTYVVHVFPALLNDPVQPVHGDDADEARFVPVDDVAGLHTTQGLLDVIKRSATFLELDNKSSAK